jgi:hypothetical protein
MSTIVAAIRNLLADHSPLEHGRPAQEPWLALQSACRKWFGHRVER